MGQRVSDRNTPPPSGASPAPAEGLPPCVSMVEYSGRVAWLMDAAACGHSWRTRFGVEAAEVSGRCQVSSTDSPHKEWQRWRCTRLISNFATDDPDEAQAAFNKGAEWVRTGEGP